MRTIEQLATLAEQALEERDYQKAQEFAWQQLDMDKLRESAVWSSFLDKDSNVVKVLKYP